MPYKIRISPPTRQGNIYGWAVLDTSPGVPTGREIIRSGSADTFDEAKELAEEAADKHEANYGRTEYDYTPKSWSPPDPASLLPKGPQE